MRAGRAGWRHLIDDRTLVLSALRGSGSSTRRMRDAEILASALPSTMER